MTPADIIRLAELADYPLLEFDGKKHVHAALLRMFKLAVAEEREACAELCERMARRTDDICSAALEMAAENIRARREK